MVVLDLQKNFKITGTGSALPKLSVSNDDLATFLDTSDEWIKSRTGISKRHIITDETVTELALIASQKALDSAGILADELDYIIATTICGDFLTPSLACVVQGELGAKCPAFDMNAACTGFIYAVDIANSFIKSGRASKILIVAAEGMSRLVDWTDRSTCVLFGDGAGAVVVEACEKAESRVEYIKLKSFGAVKPLYAPFMKGNFPFEKLGVKDGKPDQSHYFKMDGGEVYKFAVGSICDGISGALKKSGITIDEISYIFLHQANKRIIDAAMKKLNIPNDKLICNIAEVGNVSAASIPIILDKANAEGKLSRGDIIVLSGFGAGLTNGTAILRW